MCIALADSREFGRRVRLNSNNEEFVVCYAEATEGTLGYWLENADGDKYYFEAEDITFINPLLKEIREMENSSITMTAPGSTAEN